jgi:uncharacterized protein YqjF (DUF2071 family)
MDAFQTLLNTTDHRPFPPPTSAWVMKQTWRNVLFLNMPVNADALAETLPAGLEPDTYQGQAWVSIVPFQLAMTPRGFPHLLSETFWPIRFNELNVRTYVRFKNQPGVYFYSLDADDAFSVASARGLFGLNYFRAKMSMSLPKDVFTENIVFESRRRHAPYPSSVFSAHYQPESVRLEVKPGSLAEWLTSRWCFFCPNKSHGFIRGDIHHEQWPLYPARWHIEAESLLLDHQLPKAQGAMIGYFSPKVHVLAWPPQTVSLE